MPDSLLSIPPLIPLPSESKTKSAGDPLSSLFTPLNTSGKPVFPISLPKTKAVEAPLSPSSDFGSFVSVTAFDDPLQSLLGDGQTPTVAASTNFFHEFGGEAKERTGKDESRILNELLEHEKDPIQWLERPRESSGSPFAANTPGEVSTPTSTGSATPVEAPPMLSPMIDLGDDTMTLEHRLRQSTIDDDCTYAANILQLMQTDSPVPALTAPKPINPPRSSSPPPRRSLSRSPSSTSALSRSWISSFLPHARARSTSNASNALFPEDVQPPSDHASHVTAKPHWQHTLPASMPSRGFKTVSAVSAPANHVKSLTDDSPFASHPYVPPSGAPGFAGDHKWNRGFEYDPEELEKQSVRLTGRWDVTKPVLTVPLADALRPSLPALCRLTTSWKLLYSLDQHGISLKTLYTRCEEHSEGALVVMQDANGYVFGAWVGEGVHLSKGSFYGSGDSFLWSCPRHRVKDVHVYKWTGKNDYVALCEPEFISFGGGEGHYGLYLENNLIDGTTNPCPTFGNESLSSGEKFGQMVKFECVGLEVWGISL